MRLGKEGRTGPGPKEAGDLRRRTKTKRQKSQRKGVERQREKNRQGACKNEKNLISKPVSTGGRKTGIGLWGESGEKILSQHEDYETEESVIGSPEKK